jgi:hypothetical protein
VEAQDPRNRDLERELQRAVVAHRREIDRVEKMRAAPAAWWARPWVWGGGILLLVLIVATLLYTQSQVEGIRRREDLLVKVYDQTLPLPLRESYLRELVDDGVRSFPGLKLLNADLRGLRAPSISLRSAVLTGSRFDGADLTDADFSGAVLLRAGFVRANLRGAKLDQATLREADLTAADLTGASLEGTHLQDARTQGAMGLTAKPMEPAMTDSMSTEPIYTDMGTEMGTESSPVQ